MPLLSQRREVGEFRKRYKWMALVVLLVFGVLLVRAMQLQIFGREHYSRIARENITRTIIRPASRGIIYDTHHRVLASNEATYALYVTPRLLSEDEIDRIARLMQLDDDATAGLVARIAAVPPRRQMHQIEVFDDLTRDQVAALETHATALRGIDVMSIPRRTYPFGRLAAHAIGYLNEVSAEDLERLAGRGYHAGDRVGRMGVEAAWESYLRGRRGYRRELHSRVGYGAPERASADQDQREPVPGRNLTTTLDMDAMRIVERAFRGHPSGAVVIVDVQTGAVRALFSKPAYDLNEMSGHLSHAQYTEMVEDPFRPLIDKTAYESYFPGSIFKPISALSALGDDVLDPSARIDCPGFLEVGNRRFRCTMAHGEVDMRRALVRSCNVYFWKLAEQVGLERLNRYARDLGLGEPAGLGINSEAAGFLASREWYERRHENRFMVGFTMNTAIGQGNTRVTLIQMAMAYAAIANGGTLYAPLFIERVEAPNGDVIEEFGPRVRRRISVASEHLTYVIDGLYGVVNDPTGTAYDARVEDGIPVAGKTGTAQVARRLPVRGQSARRAQYFNRDHAWFAGFAPAGDPEVAVVVLVEHGGGGGRYAAPIATRVLQQYLTSRAAADAARDRATPARGAP